MEAKAAFGALKQAVSTAPILVLPNFHKQFVVETDASNYGIGAILQQEGHPIAFISKALAIQHHSRSTYEKEFMALVFAVEKWRPYLLGRHFIIKTDLQSLKHLMEQRILTHLQQKFITKLLPYDYEVQYKKGRENAAVNALSRLPTSSISANSLLTIHPL